MQRHIRTCAEVSSTRAAAPDGAARACRSPRTRKNSGTEKSRAHYFAIGSESVVVALASKARSLGTYAYGLRIPVTENQGPVLRAGIQAYMMGNDAFYSSLLELPQLHGGWQWSPGSAVLEVAATTGVALTGRFRSGTAETREMSGFTYGAHASMQVALDSDVDDRASAFPRVDGQGPVDMATGSLCIGTSPIELCADAPRDNKPTHASRKAPRKSARSTAASPSASPAALNEYEQCRYCAAR